MRLVCLLSWFDEQPATLLRLIASLPIAHVTHLVALDGRYQLYPCDYDQSPPDQAAAIREACLHARIGCTIETPDGPYTNNEVEKRTRLFQLAETVTTPDSWYLVMDADESVLTAPADLLARLATTEHDAGETTYIQRGGELDLRKLFRASRGLHVAGNHYTYLTADGRKLWGQTPTGPMEPALHSGLEVTHHFSERTVLRDRAKHRYYADRDTQRIEIHG